MLGDETPQPRVILLGSGLQGMMAAVAAAAGCTIEFGGPGPGRWPSKQPRHSNAPRHERLLPLQLTAGAVDHIYTEKPLTKRQKRRLRGKGSA